MWTQIVRFAALATLAFMALALTGCAPEETDFDIGVTASPILWRQELGPDERELDCGESETYVSPKTAFTSYMNAGDTILVGGDVLMDYTTFGDGDSDDLAETRLACRPGTTITPTPGSSALLAMTGQNLWQSLGYGNLSDAHGTRAVYTAATTGTHVCWLIYKCQPVREVWDEPWAPDGKVTVRGTSSIHHYDVNEYPGANFKLQANDPLTSTNPDEIQVGQWNAGWRTRWDGEVVVRWSPHVSSCLDGDDYCDGLATGISPGFQWRLRVWQYNGSTLCNMLTGPWSSTEPCNDDEHHCDVHVWTTNFPIVHGSGNVAACGDGQKSTRTFIAFADMRKPYDGSPFGDLLVHGMDNHPYTNLTIYSRP